MDSLFYFSTRLKQLRESHGLTQSKLAKALNLSRGAISFYETQSRTPDITVLERVSSYFGVSYDYLLGRSDYPRDATAFGRRKGMDDVAQFANENTGLFFLIAECCRTINALTLSPPHKSYLKDLVSHILFSLTLAISDINDLAPKINQHVEDYCQFLEKLSGDDAIINDEPAEETICDNLIPEIISIKIGKYIEIARSSVEDLVFTLSREGPKDEIQMLKNIMTFMKNQLEEGDADGQHPKAGE